MTSTCHAPRKPTSGYLAAEACYHACENAIFTHGGMGYAKEYHVERYLRESGDSPPGTREPPAYLVLYRRKSIGSAQVLLSPKRTTCR